MMCGYNNAIILWKICYTTYMISRLVFELNEFTRLFCKLVCRISRVTRVSSKTHLANHVSSIPIIHNIIEFYTHTSFTRIFNQTNNRVNFKKSLSSCIHTNYIYIVWIVISILAYSSEILTRDQANRRTQLTRFQITRLWVTRLAKSSHD